MFESELELRLSLSLIMFESEPELRLNLILSYV